MMTGLNRQGVLVRRGNVVIETYVDGRGPTMVILPSYGRDGGEDFDDITCRLVEAGWRVLRPQPRGIGGSKGPMSGVSLRDLAGDVASVIEELSDGPVPVLGHAFGNLVTRMVASSHSESVRAVVLACSQCSDPPPDVATTPFIAGDPSLPIPQRMAALRLGFFAPGNDPSLWLSGWYPDTLRMQRGAIEAAKQSEYWTAGTVPILEVTPTSDAFKPRRAWGEMRAQLGNRVTTVMVENAGHALFPEQPAGVAQAILPWLERHHSESKFATPR